MIAQAPCLDTWDRKAFESTLTAVIENARHKAARHNADLADIMEQLQTLIARGGKRLRPYLVEFAYQAYGGQSSRIHRVAASQELFHAAMLIHDDIIDRDTLRWGGQNIAGHYGQYFRAHCSATTAEHLAQSWALMAGDICLGLSNQMLIESGFSPTLVCDALSLAQDTLTTTIGGEITDTLMPYASKHNTQKISRIVSTYQQKTATYTFCTPLVLGALFAKADTPQLHALEQFGKNLGVAYQLRDDILDIYSTPQSLGRPIASDIREGKQTALLYFGLALASSAERARLTSLLGNNALTTEDVQSIQTTLTRCGAQAKTQRLLQRYCTAALKQLNNLNISSDHKKPLLELVDFCRN